MEDGFAHMYKKYSSRERNVNIAHFPLETSEILSLFDYSLCLKDLLKLKPEDKKTATKPKTSKAVPLMELKEREKAVLGVLIKYPGLNDAEIAEKVSITRQTASKIKAGLIKEGAIKLINEPNFKKIGCELFVATHTRFNPQVEPNKRKLLLEKPKSKCPTIIDVESCTEEMCGGFFEDYLSFKMTQDDLEKVYRQKDLLLREPVTQIIPMQQIKFYKIDFVPITEKALNIKIP
ncbi:MAG: helix-turn-helix domain-containing protein [Candidatus Diapherotrites archaeon]